MKCKILLFKCVISRPDPKLRLAVGGNLLTGSIPTEIGNLTNLWELILANNQLNGWIPPEIGNLVNLDFFNFGNNNLSGIFPATFSNLLSLQAIYMPNNCLSGGFAAVSHVPYIYGIDTQRPGDINLDEIIDIGDVIIMLQILSGHPPANIDLCGDANANGKIGLEDALNSLQVISGLKP